MELKEKSLLEQIESAQKKEAGASAKASSLESQLLENSKQQEEDHNDLHQKMVAQLKSVEAQRDEAIQQKELTLTQAQETSNQLDKFKKKASEHEQEIEDIQAQCDEKSKKIQELNLKAKDLELTTSSS